MPVPELTCFVVTFPARVVVLLTVRYSSAVPVPTPTVLPNTAMPVIVNPSVPLPVPFTVLSNVIVEPANVTSAPSVNNSP